MLTAAGLTLAYLGGAVALWWLTRTVRDIEEEQ